MWDALQLNLNFVSPPLPPQEKKNDRKQCPFCGHVGAHSNMPAHLMALHPDKVEIFPCRFCKYRSIKKRCLRKHMLERHRDDIGSVANVEDFL